MTFSQWPPCTHKCFSPGRNALEWMDENSENSKGARKRRVESSVWGKGTSHTVKNNVIVFKTFQDVDFIGGRPCTTTVERISKLPRKRFEPWPRQIDRGAYSRHEGNAPAMRCTSCTRPLVTRICLDTA